MILDSGYFGELIISKIIGADRSDKSITVRCDKIKDKEYKCEFIGEYYNVYFLHENEIRKIFEVTGIDIEIKDKINITIPDNIVRELHERYKEFHEKCSKEKCYVTPDIPVEFKDGSFRNPVAFLKAYIEGKPFYPDVNKTFNQITAQLFKEYNLKILVDKSFDIFFKEFGIYNATDMLSNMLNNVFKQLGLTDVVEITDLKPKIHLFDITIEKGRAKIFGEVILDPYERKIILRTDKGEKVFTEKDIERHEALKRVFDEILSKAVHIQAIHEGIKRLITAKDTVKIYYPETSIIDFILRSISRREDVKSKDKDIYESIGIIHAPE